MKLNPDCVRDVMLALEDLLTINACGYFGCVTLNDLQQNDLIQGKYDLPSLKYTLIQLHESKYIVSDFSVDVAHLKYSLQYILYITPQGHDFLATIQSNETWKPIKRVLQVAGNVSLSMLESISKGVADAWLSRILQSSLSEGSLPS